MSFLKNEARGEVRVGRLVTVVIISFLALVLLPGSFGTIDEGERGVKTRFGEVVSIYEPGLYLKMPLIESMKKFSIRTQTVVYDLKDPLYAASGDQQDADVAAVFNYRLDSLEVEDVYKQYGSLRAYESDVIRPTIIDTAKAAAAKFTAEKLITSRDLYTETAFEMLTERFATSSIVVERVNITNIRFSPEYTQSIERKVTAEQNALTEKNNLVAKEFIAQQRIVEAQAEAEAITIQAEAINSQGGEDYVELKRVEKWNGQACTSYCGLETSNGILINR